ncbi:MAG TPA: hypothetical protein VFC92_01835 [Bacteroidales bacterium]|nr:hypothetical protein [Bacteroidales bacterium]HZK23555.1 hypothetical protein [Atopostipes sp.]
MGSSKIKIAHYTWWICGIIGLFIGLAQADGRINGYGIMGVAGIVNGVVFGWLIGFIIDKIKEFSPVQNMTQKIGEIKQEKELIQQTKDSLKDYNDAKQRFQYLSNETLLEKFQKYVSLEVSDMERLALEEELVERGVLTHSPMHEKLDKIIEHFKTQ